MFRMCRHRFDVWFRSLPLEVAEKFCAGVFRKFISENTSIPVFGNELPNCIRSSIFLFLLLSRILIDFNCLQEHVRQPTSTHQTGERVPDCVGAAGVDTGTGAGPGTPCASSRGRGRGYIWFRI